MRAWGQRGDTVVVDEPLYAYYLDATPVDHPGRDEILAHQPRDWPTAVAGLTAALPDGIDISYQKHMAHHLLPAVDRRALVGLRHAFLIRDPRALVASYAQVRQAPTLDDLGLRQQVELHRALGGPVIDAGDILRQPRPALEALCASLDVAFDPAMLSWPPGPRATDGVWGPYWYTSVWASTGFGPPPAPPPPTPASLLPLLGHCLPLYNELWNQRLVIE
jgi:hypothetical protein